MIATETTMEIFLCALTRAITCKPCGVPSRMHLRGCREAVVLREVAERLFALYGTARVCVLSIKIVV